MPTMLNSIRDLIQPDRIPVALLQFLKKRGVLVAIFVLFCVCLAPVSPTRASDTASISGRVIDSQKQPVQGAAVTLYLNNQTEPYLESETNEDGVFLLDFSSKIDAISLEVYHPHFDGSTWEGSEEDIGGLNAGASIRVDDIEIDRRLTAGFWITAVVFAGVLTLIITERLHSTIAAILGAGVIVIVSLLSGLFGDQFYILSLEQAIEYVDFDVIFLVLGMMIIVGTIERTGIFQWIAYHAYRVSRGKLWLLSIILMLFTSVASALLDNVTTMLLMVPITIQIALTLGVNPLSLIIPEMLASNVGGIATLIGTPNNILIGSYAGIGFNDFLTDLTPGVLIVQLVMMVYVLIIFQPQYRQASETQSQVLLDLLKENAQISEPENLKKAGIVFLGTLLLFIVGEHFYLIPAVTAVIGAAITLLVVNADVDEILRVVDWATLIFFIALFMIIGAIQEIGLISLIAQGINNLVAGSLLGATLAVIWGVGFLCLLVPTIPLTAAFLPVVGFLSRSIPGVDSNVLYYSLSMGSALGANNSLIGATNNMVTAGIAKRAGYPITYREFIKVGFPAAILTLLIGSIYILIRF